MKAKPHPEQSFLNELFHYNKETGDLTWKERPLHHFKKESTMKMWNGKNAGKRCGTLLVNKKTGKKYLQTGIGGKLYLNHRLIYILMSGHISETEQVDHKDGNGLNNAWENIRLVSGHDENSKNHRLQKNNTSGYSGVSWHSGSKKWHARINIGKKRVTIGYFDTPKAAHQSRLKALKENGYHPNHGTDRPL